MKRIGVVVAVEINSVLRKYGLPQEEVFENGFKVNIYKNDAFCMYVIDAGAGEISSAISTQYLITKYNCEIIVNFGVVGALTAESKVAELCIVEKVIHYDFDTTGWLNLKTGQYPNHNSEYMNTDELLFEKCP